MLFRSKVGLRFQKSLYGGLAVAEGGINQAPASRYAIARVGMPDTPVGDFKRAIRNLKIIDATP